MRTTVPATVLAIALGIAAGAGAQPVEPSAPQPPAPPVPMPVPPPVPAAAAHPAVPQTPATLPTPPAPPVVQVPQVPRAPAPPPPPMKPGQAVNIEIEVTITEGSAAAPATKTVSMLAADATWGRVRSQGSTRPNAARDAAAAALNVDARPQLIAADTLRLELTIEYAPAEADTPAAADGVRPARLHQSLNVVVKSGQSLRVSQAVDPVSNRRTTVDVKATRVP